MQFLGNDTEFRVRGHHPFFYPVDLPPWLPADTMKTIVTHFEYYLVWELQNFFLQFSKASKGHSRHNSDALESTASGLSNASGGPSNNGDDEWESMLDHLELEDHDNKA